MKKTFIYTAAFIGLFATAGSVNAQKMYSGINFHYGFGICPMEGESFDYSYNTDIVTYKSTRVSLGEGFTSGIYAGYFVKNNIGLELGINYLYGSKNVLFRETETDFEYFEEDVYTIRANSIRFIPTLRIKFGQKKLGTYIKTGLIVGVGTKAILTEEYKEMSIGPSYESTYQLEFTGGLSLGFHSGIGLNYTLGKFNVFAEASGYFQNWAPKHGEVVKNEVNGINALNTMTTREKETDFVDEYSYNIGTTPNESQPSKDVKFFLPMSSVGLSLGVQFNFGKAE